MGRDVIADAEPIGQVLRLLIDPPGESRAGRCRTVQQTVEVDASALIHAPAEPLQVVAVGTVLVGAQKQTAATVGKVCRCQTGMLQRLPGNVFGQHTLPWVQRRVAAETGTDPLPLRIVDKTGGAVVESQRLEPRMFADTGLLPANPLEQRGSVQRHGRHQTEPAHIDFSCPHENSYTASLV